MALPQLPELPRRHRWLSLLLDREHRAPQEPSPKQSLQNHTIPQTSALDIADS
jgi:hypothetical protein